MSPKSHPNPQTLNLAFLTTAWTFQLVAAGPIFIWLGLATIFNLFYTFDRASDFVTHLCTSLLAAGIFFIVLVQRKLHNNKDTALNNRPLTLRFEIAKLLLATLLWVWLMMDAVFGPDDHYGYARERQTRIVASAVSVVLIFVLFLPTVLFVVHDGKLALREEDVPEGEEAGERASLLRESMSGEA